MKNELEDLRKILKSLTYDCELMREPLAYSMAIFGDDWLDALCVQDKFILLEEIKNKRLTMSDKLKNEFVYKIEKGIRKEKINKLKYDKD